MGTHWIIFLTIGNLVCPPSFPFAGQVKGQTGPPPPNDRSVRSRQLKPGCQAVGSVVSLVSLARQDVYSWAVGIELGRAGLKGGGLPSSPFRSARRGHNSTKSAS